MKNKSTQYYNGFRDVFGRMIRVNDIIAHSMKHQTSGLELSRVFKLSNKILWSKNLRTGKRRQVYPSNCMVVTSQIRENMEGNVGAQLTEEDKLIIRNSNKCQLAVDYFNNLGIDAIEEAKEMRKKK